MNKQWHEKFAVEGAGVAGAVVDESGHIGFGETIAPGVMAIESATSYKSPKLVELSQLSVIDVVGEEAAEFLQAQICNDLTALGKGEVQINGYCTPKGRLKALFTVFAIEGGHRLLMPADIAPVFVKRLNMFVLRAKATITLRTDLVCTGLVLDIDGEPVPAGWPSALRALPAVAMSVAGEDTAQIVRWHDDTGSVAEQKNLARYICIGLVDTLFPLWQSDTFSHATWAYWRWGDINAGIPNVFDASADQFIPQMLNMQLINALSFKKGCYPGQEIVARMQYLGKLKKHMKHLHQPGGTVAPAPATTLTTESNNNAGQVVDAVVDEHGVNLLAVVNIETPVSDLMLAGQGLTEAAIPYSLTPDTESSS